MLRGRGEPTTVIRGVKSVVDPVVTELEPRRNLGRTAGPFAMRVMGVAETGGGAGVLLLELVAVDRVVQRVGEVGEEVEVVAEDVGLQPVLGTAMTMTPVGRPRDVARVTPVRRIHVAPGRQRPRFDQRKRDLVARAPLALIEAQGGREAVVVVPARPGQLSVGAAEIVAHLPGSVGVGALDGVKKFARSCLHRVGDESAAVAEGAAFEEQQ